MKNLVYMAQVNKFIRLHNWKDASTYAKIAPHQYVVREHLGPTDKKDFDAFCKIIQKYGVKEYYYETLFKYLYVGKYKYFLHQKDGPTWEVLNRARSDTKYTIKGDKV